MRRLVAVCQPRPSFALGTWGTLSWARPNGAQDCDLQNQKHSAGLWPGFIAFFRVTSSSGVLKQEWAGGLSPGRCLGHGPEPLTEGLEVPWLGLGSWVPQPSSLLLHSRGGHACGRKQLVLGCKAGKGITVPKPCSDRWLLGCWWAEAGPAVVLVMPSLPLWVGST